MPTQELTHEVDTFIQKGTANEIKPTTKNPSSVAPWNPIQPAPIKPPSTIATKKQAPPPQPPPTAREMAAANAISGWIAASVKQNTIKDQEALAKHRCQCSTKIRHC